MLSTRYRPLNQIHQCTARFASYTAVPKKTLQPYLFEFKFPLSYAKTIDTITACRDDKQLPKKVDACHLMTLKKVFETMRKRTGSIINENVQIERNLVERAAELGDATAIAIMCGDTISDPAATEDDKEYANKLLTELMDRKFSLSFKISGDLAYKMGLKEAALDFYKRAIDSGIHDSSIKTECLRNIGLLLFAQKDTLEAMKYFTEAINLADDNNQVADCHYYLGQMSENEKIKARYHFERAAMASLKEAFAPLGFLLLNYFNKPNLAYEWFTLGGHLGDGHCLIGLFDCCMNKKDYVKAQGYVKKLSDHTNGEPLLATRQNALQILQKHLSETNETSHTTSDTNNSQNKGESVKSDRWGF